MTDTNNGLRVFNKGTVGPPAGHTMNGMSPRRRIIMLIDENRWRVAEQTRRGAYTEDSSAKGLAAANGSTSCRRFLRGRIPR